MQKNKYWASLLFVAFASQASANSVVEERLQAYVAEGAANFSAQQGEALWMSDHPDPDKPGKARNCSTCHGSDLTQSGKHAKTGKVIDPIAPSANAERLTDAKTIEKWFKRNCKWVLGRECSPQEKGDVLLYLQDK